LGSECNSINLWPIPSGKYAASGGSEPENDNCNKVIKYNLL
jgi:hypothetical protein